MGSEWETVKFNELLSEPLRNVLFRPKRVRGEGVKMVNMGELFAFDRIKDRTCSLNSFQRLSVLICLSAII